MNPSSFEAAVDLPRVGVLYKANSSAGLRDIYVASQGVCNVIIFSLKLDMQETPEVFFAAQSLFEVASFTHRMDLLERVTSMRLDGLTTFHDNYLDLVDFVLQATKLPGSGSVGNPWDKKIQRRKFLKCGASKVRSMQVECATDLSKAVANIGLPGVLKPRRSVSGIGVTFINNVCDVEFQNTQRESWCGLLYEESMAGNEAISSLPAVGDTISVESVSTDRDHVHLALFDQLPRSIAPRQGVDTSDSVATTGMFSPTRLTGNLRESALSCASLALEALDIRWRVTHTEIRITEHGPEALEVNGRVGGHVANVLRILGGPDLVRVSLLAAFASPEAARAIPAIDVEHHRTVGELYMSFPQRAGWVLSNVSRADLLRIPGTIGVDQVARQGDARSVTRFLAFNNLSMKLEDGSDFIRHLQSTIRYAARLFAKDGLLEDSWVKRMCDE